MRSLDEQSGRCPPPPNRAPHAAQFAAVLFIISLSNVPFLRVDDDADDDITHQPTAAIIYRCFISLLVDCPCLSTSSPCFPLISNPGRSLMRGARYFSSTIPHRPPQTLCHAQNMHVPSVYSQPHHVAHSFAVLDRNSRISTYYVSQCQNLGSIR